VEKALEMISERFNIEKPQAGGVLQQLIDLQGVQLAQKKHNVLVRCSKPSNSRLPVYLDPITSLTDVHPEDLAKQLTLIAQSMLPCTQHVAGGWLVSHTHKRTVALRNRTFSQCHAKESGYQAEIGCTNMGGPCM
jgi:hypothetical protein